MMDNIKDISSSLRDFENRVNKLENSSQQVMYEINHRDQLLKDIDKEKKREIREQKKEIHDLRNQIDSFNKEIKHTIHEMKKLGTGKELNDVKEKIENMQYEELVTEQGIRRMVREQLKQ
ncbi:MAG: hypothetical protein ACQEP1_03220 [Nanobdellota archaeon]